MRLFYINAFVTPVFTVAFRPESRSHSYSYAPSIHDEIRRVKTGFGFNSCYETPSYKSLNSVPENLTMIIPGDKPHCKHQEPFNCCAQWAVWGENGSVIRPRLIPDELVPLLRFGCPKSKEKPLRINSKGVVLAQSIAATRRLSEESAKIFEELFENV